MISLCIFTTEIENIKRKSSYTIAIVLQNSVNKAIIKVTFPDSLKLGNITQDFNKKDLNDKANFRPDIVLPVVSTLFGSIIRKQMDVCKSNYLRPIYVFMTSNTVSSN